ncbi:MAG: pyridoxamine 5'-phosphate oxidase family protein [Desulfuromonas sp.]|nr:MAG: pyridoxamine 5'-phosphate oxidase family protein [Desulfuromonas sp.]
MRRNEKEIKEFERIEEVIRKAPICRLGLNDNGRTYIVPMNFGYKDKTLYFHSAKAGKKVDLLKANPEVCFELDIDFGLVKKEKEGCSWSARYRSVIGYGRAEMIERLEQKREALDILMAHYSDESFNYPFASIEKTLLFKVEIESVTGKQSI